MPQSQSKPCAPLGAGRHDMSDRANHVSVCPLCGKPVASAGLVWDQDTGGHLAVRCESCKLTGLGSPLDHGQLDDFYARDYYAQNMTENPSVRSRAKQYLEQSQGSLLGTLRDFLSIGWLPRPSSPGARFLDIGCGDGATLARAECLGWIAEGCEISEAACSKAVSRGYRCYFGDWEESLPTAAFDLILMNHVLEHVADPRRSLAAAASALKDDGLLLLGVPNWDSSLARRFGLAWWANKPPQHLWHLKPGHILGLLDDAGLVARAVRSQPAVSGLLKPSVWREQHATARRAGWTRAAFVSGYAGAALEQAIERGVRGQRALNCEMYTMECCKKSADCTDDQQTEDVGRQA